MRVGHTFERENKYPVYHRTRGMCIEIKSCKSKHRDGKPSYERDRQRQQPRKSFTIAASSCSVLSRAKQNRQQSGGYNKIHVFVNSGALFNEKCDSYYKKREQTDYERRIKRTCAFGIARARTGSTLLQENEKK